MVTDYPELYRQMGLRIAYVRKAVGYTQEEFAEKIGRSTNFLAQVEAAGIVKGISLETLFKIAEVLEVPVSNLLENRLFET